MKFWNLSLLNVHNLKIHNWHFDDRKTENWDNLHEHKYVHKLKFIKDWKSEN